MSLAQREEDRGSEEIIEMYCEVCKKKGKDRSADGFCLDCVRYFCTKCLAYHTEFLPDHIHKDKKNMPQDVCLNPCPGHADEIIKFYCFSCNMFFCSLCKHNQHSDCIGVSHLPEVANQLEKTTTFKEFIRDLDEVFEEACNIESVIASDKELIEGFSSTALSTIDLTRQRFIKYLDDRVEEIKREVQSKKDRDSNAIENYSYRLSAIKSEIDTIKSKSDQIQRDVRRCELFMLMKDGERESKSFKDELKQMKESNINKYEFQHSTEDELFFKNTFKLGRLVAEESEENQRDLENRAIKHSVTENINSNSTSMGLRKGLNSSIVRSLSDGPRDTESIAKPLKFVKKATKDTWPPESAIKSDCGRIPDTETQKSLIANQLVLPYIEGEPRFVLDVKWFKQWKSYVGYETWDYYNVGEESAHPGPIDNTPILQEGTGKLKVHLIDDLDYQLVPEEGWVKFLSWYGIMDGQEPISRRVIREGIISKSLKVEMYLWYLKICENSKPDEYVSKQFSRSNTIGQLEEIMRKEFSIPAEKEVRLWNRYKTNKYEQLRRKDNTLQDAELFQGQVIVIEKRNCDGTWPREI